MTLPGYDAWLEAPYQRAMTIAQKFENWLEDNEEELRIEFEDTHGDIESEKDEEYFTDWARDQWRMLNR
jgi:hypothetical protein